MRLKPTCRGLRLVHRVAVATLEGCEVDDLDDGSDEVKRYKSLSHGVAPMTLNFDHLDEALAALPEALKTSLAETRSVCVIVPSRHDANAVHGYLKSAKINSTILGPDERDRPDSKAVRIATMHRAKGLEFDEVVLLVPKKSEELDQKSDTNKRLKYVAISRAKRFATVIQY
ncbi:MAG: hypothetical protein EXR39_03525 [Betaproteobacteria bacterium]|nr:hypothetical protein [Betaproteobacteria bacterium]